MNVMDTLLFLGARRTHVLLPNVSPEADEYKSFLELQASRLRTRLQNLVLRLLLT
jgi:hypothetical protein